MWATVGKIGIVYILLRFLLHVWNFCRCFVFPRIGWKKNLKNFGDWAVVTGSTDGIGKAYAKELARQGLKLILISRSQDKLDAVAAEIASEHQTDIKTIAFDYGADSGYEKIEKEISGHEIGILVNNVGMSQSQPNDPKFFFADLDIDVLQKLLNVNMLSTVKMTHMILPQMLKRSKGVIIHISSATALFPWPLGTTYSASKAFVDFFARALQIEYRSKGIISQAVLPFGVLTNMTKKFIDKANIFCPSPKDYAYQALSTVGIADRTHGHWSHALQGPVANFIHTKIRDDLFMNMMLFGARDKIKKS